MSQYFQSAESAPSPPDVPTSFITDDATTAIPAANILNVFGADTSENDLDGIRTTADPDNGNNLYIQLTNRLQGTATSTNASVEDLITHDLGLTAAVYRFEFKVAGRETTTGDGVGYSIFATAKTDGVASTIVSTTFIDADEDAALLLSDIDLVSSGNDVILQFTGVAATTINLSAVGSYVVV